MFYCNIDLFFSLLYLSLHNLFLFIKKKNQLKDSSTSQSNSLLAKMSVHAFEPRPNMWGRDCWVVLYRLWTRMVVILQVWGKASPLIHLLGLNETQNRLTWILSLGFLPSITNITTQWIINLSPNGSNFSDDHLTWTWKLIPLFNSTMSIIT